MKSAMNMIYAAFLCIQTSCNPIDPTQLYHSKAECEQSLLAKMTRPRIAETGSANVARVVCAERPDIGWRVR